MVEQRHQDLRLVAGVVVGTVSEHGILRGQRQAALELLFPPYTNKKRRLSEMLIKYMT